MTNVVDLDTVSTIDTPVHKIINKAEGANLTDIVILGFDAEGELFFSSSKADAGEVFYHLEMAKYRLMKVCNREHKDE